MTGIFDSLGGLLGGAGSFLSSNPWVGDLAKAGFDMWGARRANDATSGDINRAISAGRPQPINIQSPWGSIVNQNGQMQIGAGNPFSVVPQELRGEAGTYANMLGQQADVFSGMGAQALGGVNFDPQAAAADRYSLLSKLAAPQQQRDWNTTQSNLFSAGREGTTGGLLNSPDSVRAFQESQNTADLQRQIQAQDWAAQRNQQLLDQGMSLTGAAQQAGANRYNVAGSLGQFGQNMFQPFGNLLQSSIGAGTSSSAADAAQMGIPIQASGNQNQWGAYGNLFDAFRGMIPDNSLNPVQAAPIQVGGIRMAPA